VFFVTELSPASTLLPWLLRFRWAVVLGLVAVVIAPGLQFLPVNWPLVAVAVGLAAASNGLLQLVWMPRAQHSGAFDAQAANAAGGVLLLDSLLLTLVLAGSGGAANPFTTLYLVLIVLAALVLDTRWTGFLTLWTAAGFALLFVPGINDPHAQCATAGSSAEAYDSHLKGMWLAFAAGASVLGWVVRKLSVTLREQRAQIASLREKTLKAAHLAQLATVAGGAAHELRTPLATIAVAAHELGRTLGKSERETEQCIADAALIEEEVARCQDILFALGPRFSAQKTRSECLEPRAVASRLVSDLAHQGLSVNLGECCSDVQSLLIGADEDELTQALRRLVTNAHDAVRGTAGNVTVSVAVRGSGKQRWVGFVVEDNGVGMSCDVLSQVTTPFFTTKSPGQGMGLGLFLVSAFCLATGAELSIQSKPGRGTTATLWFPFTPPGNRQLPSVRLQEQMA
jgi:two-component system, sensor histidine kinase RegB